MARTTTSPAVETHAHAQLQAPGAAHLVGGGLHGRLHGQGGIAGAQGVVFVGNGRAKQGHNAIAQHLIHRALEAVHGVHHAVDGGIEELLGGFGIETPDEFRRVLEVGKQHRDLLALAFQGGAGGEDLLGQIWRGVGQRGLGLGRGSGGRGRRAAVSPVQTRTLPRSSTARRWPSMSSFFRSSRAASSSWNWRLRVPYVSAATLEHGNRLVENLLKGHRPPSLCP